MTMNRIGFLLFFRLSARLVTVALLSRRTREAEIDRRANFSFRPGDTALLFASRIGRMFGYGLVSVVLVLHLASIGFDDTKIGLLLALTLIGDTLLSLYLTTRADRLGRRRVLMASAVLIAISGAVFALTGSFAALLAAATVGVISPSGNEVGPFLAIEQVALAQTIPPSRRTWLFAWYNVAGSFATAAGALCGGYLGSYRANFAGYAVTGVVLLALFAALSAGVECAEKTVRPAALVQSRAVVGKLSALFALDSFAGGFIVQSLLAWWFHLRYGLEVEALGRLFFFANLFAGLSSLAAARIAARIGLLKTMVFTHLPSNVLLILVPLMPNVQLAIAVLLLRFTISQMDVPTRQSYVMSVVPPHERSAAAGITGVARTIGAALAPLAATPLVATASLAALPFFVAGGLKIVYDLLLLRSFRRVRVEE
jgi:MFS family permease